MSDVTKFACTESNICPPLLTLPLTIAGRSFFLSKAVEQVKEFEKHSEHKSKSSKQRTFRNDTSSGKLKPATWKTLIKESFDNQSVAGSCEYKMFNPSDHTGAFVLNESKLHKAQRSTLETILTELEEVTWKGWDNPFNVEITAETFPPDYFFLIKKPISLVDIRRKYLSDETYSLQEFDKDVSQMLKNAMKFNREGEVVYGMARDLRSRFDLLMSEHTGKTVTQLTSPQSKKRGRTPP